MEFELLTENLLRVLLTQVDPERQGGCIEIGVGSYHWYFDLFAKAGYHTVAVEPVPVSHLWPRLAQGDVTFYQGIVGEVDGKAAIYLAKDGDTNLSSVNSDWWAAGERTEQVESMTPATVIERSAIKRLTCLKVDAEGMEPKILVQLNALPKELLPKIVMFEFGAAVKQDGRWIDGFDRHTLSCLRILQACGYGPVTTIDVHPVKRTGDLQDSIDADALFGPDSQAGNAVAMLASPPLALWSNKNASEAKES